MRALVCAIVSAAVQVSADALVLPAFGCDADRHPPQEVAFFFQDALLRAPVQAVLFGIFDRPHHIGGQRVGRDGANVVGLEDGVNLCGGCCGTTPAHIAAIAKAHITDRFMQVGRDSVEAHGGIGFTWECDVQIWFKRAMFDRAFLGGPGEHRERAVQLAPWVT